jgi:putative PIN family toxin of toxin-antitoxin system
LIVVFDASSLVDAALRIGGVPETALLTVIDQGTLVVSREVVAEYRAVLRRRKFARALSAERRESILEFIEVVARRVEPVELIADCRDPKDNMYLALAAACGATFLDNHVTCGVR